MQELTNFQHKVYEIVKQIPKGKVMTYGQIAEFALRPGAARAVGMCMKHNPDMSTIPCHRVVASNGTLTGYSAGEGITTKRSILLKEGVVFNGERVDIEKSLWSPS